MGLTPKAVPVIQIRAIIDRDVPATQIGAHSPDDVIEVD